jgi:hypothetical protein
MSSKKTTKAGSKPKAATKATPKKNATSKPPRRRLSAQAQVFDEMATPATVPEAEPTSTGEDDATPCVLCDEPGGDDHICGPEHDATPEIVTNVTADDDGEEADEDDSDDGEEPEDGDDTSDRRTRYLKCELTIADREEKRERREQLDQQVEDLDAKIQTAELEVKGLKKRRDGLESEGKALSKCIRDGYESRNVYCEERSCPNEAGTAGIATVRLDTLERIEWRELTASERQGRLF